MGSTLCLRVKLDEGTEKGGVMIAMLKDLVGIYEAEIKREAMRMRLGLRGTLVGRVGYVMRKGGYASAELAALEFETHASRVQFLEIEAAAVQAQIDAQESVGVSKINLEPNFHTANL